MMADATRESDAQGGGTPIEEVRRQVRESEGDDTFPEADGEDMVVATDCTMYRCDDGIDRGVARVRFPPRYAHLNIDRAFPLPKPTAFRTIAFAVTIAADTIASEVERGTMRFKDVPLIVVPHLGIADAAHARGGRRSGSSSGIINTMRRAIESAGAHVVHIERSEEEKVKGPVVLTLASQQELVRRGREHPEDAEGILRHEREVRAAAADLASAGGLAATSVLRSHKKARMPESW